MCPRYLTLYQICGQLFTLAGADGFTEGRKNYYSSDYKSHLEYGSKYNTAVADAIRNIGIGIRFITPSAYEK